MKANNHFPSYIRSCWNNNPYICGGYSHTTNLCDKSKTGPSTLATPVYVRTLKKEQVGNFR